MCSGQNKVLASPGLLDKSTAGIFRNCDTSAIVRRLRNCFIGRAPPKRKSGEKEGYAARVR